MFWGLNLKPNRKYTQTTTKNFHISQAALDGDSALSGATKVYITFDKQKLLICTLRKNTCEQVMLDYNFNEGDEICFQSVGSGNISLSGYLVEGLDYNDDSLGEEESDLEEAVEDLRTELNKKSKAKKADKSALYEEVGDDNLKSAEDDDDDDDEEDVSEADGEDSNDDDEDEDEDGESDDDEDEDEEDEEVQPPKPKQPKLDKPQKVQHNGVAKETESPIKKTKKNKKDKVENQQGKEQKQQEQKKQVPKERTITGGVKIEDIRVGNGPEAKIGKKAQVFYEGRLKSNNKVFDSLKQGAPFKFSLGRGEVIKGWDVGVVGMKVGGKRRITCPAHMAYGSRGSPPTIPPNSTLVFEVELKSVN